MNKLTVILVTIGIILMICGNVFYKHHPNADDSGGSASITTLNGDWSVKIPAFMGGVIFMIGVLASVVEDKKTKAVIPHLI